jgi:histidinol-phosphate aminotransferase
LKFKFLKKVFPSDANFILAEVDDADKVYQHLLLQRIIIRNRTKEPLCKNCIRITVGIPEENKKLIKALENYA